MNENIAQLKDVVVKILRAASPLARVDVKVAIIDKPRMERRLWIFKPTVMESCEIINAKIMAEEMSIEVISRFSITETGYMPRTNIYPLYKCRFSINQFNTFSMYAKKNYNLIVSGRALMENCDYILSQIDVEIEAVNLQLGA